MSGNWVRRTGSVLGTALAVTVSLAAPAAVGATAGSAGATDHRMSDADARQVLVSNGYQVWSSGNCSAKNNPNCTSFQDIWRHTVDGAVALRKYSGCGGLVITGGTEVGHSGSGRGSHVDGWKIDYRLNDCLEGYVRRNFAYVGDVGWGLQWKSPSGNIYTKERQRGSFNHWDVLYWNCGGC